MIKKDNSRLFPSHADLEKSYELLLHQIPRSPSVSELSLYSQWCRIDPRLAEIWVQFIGREWKTIHPLVLRDALLGCYWPSAAGVLLEFVAQTVPSSDANLFSKWKGLVTEGFQKGKNEQFFIGLWQLGGVLMFEDARFTRVEYRKWGYLGRENLNRARTISRQRRKKSSLDSSTRIEILKYLLDTCEKVNTALYWEAIGKCVSRRQAERDLIDCGLVKGYGRTRNKFYVQKN